MKKFSIILMAVILAILMIGSAHAAHYSLDYLEPGNPGGWGTSAKTFDKEITVVPGKTFFIDIWARGDDFPDPATGGFWLDFQGYEDNLTIKDAKIYIDKDGELSGPWEHAGPTLIGPTQQNVPGGVVLNAVICLAGAPLDADGDIILARIELVCKRETPIEAPVQIAVKTIPDFGTWTRDPWKDSDIPETTFLLNCNAVSSTGLKWRPGCFIDNIAH